MTDRNEITDSDLRLHCGEMTPAELRACRAGFEYGRLRAGVPDGWPREWRSALRIACDVLETEAAMRVEGGHDADARQMRRAGNTICKMLAAAPAPEAAPQPAGEAVPRPDLVPGVMRCAKCAFQLHRVTLYVRSGTTGAGDSDTEPCPNGCGPLWPVTWRQWAEEAQEYAQRLQGELDALKAEPAPSAPSIYDAYMTWPEDIRTKLSIHDLRRMGGWAPRPNPEGWEIDTSAGRPILVHEKCSVIEAETATYVLGLIAKDTTPEAGQPEGFTGERIEQIDGESRVVRRDGGRFVSSVPAPAAVEAEKVGEAVAWAHDTPYGRTYSFADELGEAFPGLLSHPAPEAPDSAPSSPAPAVGGEAVDRDAGGRIVREAWVRWALTQPSPKPSWLVPYDNLSEPDKEADRQIFEAVAGAIGTHPAPAAAEAGGVEALPNRWRNIKPGLSALGCANELEHAITKESSRRLASAPQSAGSEQHGECAEAGE